jgi:hypothetical protein
MVHIRIFLGHAFLSNLSKISTVITIIITWHESCCVLHRC